MNFKFLKKGFAKTGGRNTRGKITVYHKGGGNKKLYRFIDFKKDFSQAIVKKLEYDPNRTANIALLQDLKTLKYSYIVAPKGIKVGDLITNQFNVTESINNINGTCMYIKDIPLGVYIHNIEIVPGKGAQLVRSAGCYAMIIKKEENYAIIKLNNKFSKKISLKCKATLGIVSNSEHYLQIIGKAGKSRGMNIRPTVRGTAMNPIDHPHGGGEGKTSGGRPSVTPWGIITKGKKTRKNKSHKYEI
ncbi:hypothetical protein WA158_002652 [Blastocystis sp. Blastoise]